MTHQSPPPQGALFGCLPPTALVLHIQAARASFDAILSRELTHACLPCISQGSRHISIMRTTVSLLTGC